MLAPWVLVSHTKEDTIKKRGAVLDDCDMRHGVQEPILDCR